MIDISVVVPVYGCPEALVPLHDRIVETVKKLKKSYEIILVNDACPKGSWEVIQKICREDKKTVGVNLSRNFGQIHSTNAGIAKSKGQYVVLMDCDLQDPPEGIEKLYQTISEGHDIVFAKRKDRKDGPVAKMFSKLFYKVYNYFVDGYFDGDIANFCIVKRKVVDEYNKISDRNKSFTTTLAWMGFDTRTIEIESEERFEGKSSYTLGKKINLAIDMITSQSNKPLKFLMFFGFVMVLISLVAILIKIIAHFMGNDAPLGWTSLLATIVFIGGIQIISIGGVGIYIGNIFNQTNGRPEYLVSTVLNDNKNQ